MVAVTLLSLWAVFESERIAGDHFEGRWTSSAIDDRFLGARITREGGQLYVILSQACDPGCAFPKTPVVVFGAEDRPASQHGLGMFSQGMLKMHVIVRLKGDVLSVDSYEWVQATTFRRHRRSQLVRQASVTTTPTGFAAPPFPSALFEEFFNQVVPAPAYYVDPTDMCGTSPNATATAYLRVTEKTSNLLRIKLSAYQRVTLRNQRTVLTPAGRPRVLVVLIAYAETVGDRGITDWQQGQAAVNADHAAFAKSRGYDKPLVVFDNTNLVIQRSDIGDPHNAAHVRAAAQAKGLQPDTFDAVIMIDLDPIRFAGGLATLATRSIYVGNYGHWQSPIDARQWGYVAQTAYHHEFAHLWGWEHDWSPSCGNSRASFAPFVAFPALFGWEDLDGDRVPEILDATPYGRMK